MNHTRAIVSSFHHNMFLRFRRAAHDHCVDCTFLAVCEVIHRRIEVGLLRLHRGNTIFDRIYADFLCFLNHRFRRLRGYAKTGDLFSRFLTVSGRENHGCFAVGDCHGILPDFLNPQHSLRALCLRLAVNLLCHRFCVCLAHTRVHIHRGKEMQRALFVRQREIQFFGLLMRNRFALIGDFGRTEHGIDREAVLAGALNAVLHGIQRFLLCSVLHAACTGVFVLDDLLRLEVFHFERTVSG